MSYNPTNWKSGDKVTSVRLNNLERGVTNLDEEINNKVDKVTGMGLSTNDYTTADKTKLNELDNSLNNITTADTSDVGKYLKVKTITDGKVSTWEFDEPSGGGSGSDVNLGLSIVSGQLCVTYNE